jgi:glycosyltransferase involved in cell wall biosynthesis
MKVSVIIPVYNVKPYLERCVKSVVGQTYQELEIILVDDGSKDGSGKLCDKLADSDSRIKVVHQKNQGLSGARNTGIRQATGEYVVFLDSDDEWLLSDGLEKLLSEDKTDIIAFKRVDIWNKNQRVLCADYDTAAIAKMPDTQAVFSYLVTTQQLQISACFLLVRRQMLLDHDILFPIGLLSEDIYWSMLLWQHIQTVRFTNLNFYGYYHREASITTTATIRSYHSYDQIFTYWKAQCDEGCKNATAIRAFMANMWVSRGYAYHSMADNDKPEALRILQKHIDLLNYSQTPKSKRVRRMVPLIGVKNTAAVLGWYWRLRNCIKH